MNTNSIDETLEIVRDIDKFKARIEQLGKVKAQADESMEKAKAKNKELNAAMDTKVAKADKLVDAAKGRAAAHDASVATAFKDIAEEKSKVTKLIRSIEKREKTLEQERGIFEKAKVEQAQAVQDQATRAEVFKNAVNGAVSALGK